MAALRLLSSLQYLRVSRSVLFGQWGFGADGQKGITVLLHGQPGTGKSLAAEALGYEVGKPLKVNYVLVRLLTYM